MAERDLADSLFPGDPPPPAELERRYPPRDLPAGAHVTRFAPSPTGFVHIGGVYAALVSRDLARQGGGVYLVRLEDTDRRREAQGARDALARALAVFDLRPDEDDPDGPYGPYEQSRRGPLYETYARGLVRAGVAYPCFCSREELAAMGARQRGAGVPTGYHGEWARCRALSPDVVGDRLARGDPYTVRFRSPAAAGERCTYHDLVRGDIEQDANRNDAVILKSSDEPPRLPTYHFAHVVDDHLMRVDLVVRGEEWIASVPLHLQLFAALGLEPPPYAHIAPLMKTEGSSRRKLSKRRDPEADVEFYGRAGYPVPAVVHYLRGLFNARLADLGFAEAAAMPLVLSEAGVAGPLVDLAKLESVARDWIAELTAERAYGELTAWARRHDPDLAQLLEARAELAVRALAVERGGAKARKDLARWSDFRRLYGFFFAELFAPVAPDDGRYAPAPAGLVRALAAAMAAGYRDAPDAAEWFSQVRAVATAHGFAPGVREHRADPGRYAGSIRDVANVVRVALTGATRSPDLHEVAAVLGRDEVVRRLRAVAAAEG